MICYHGTTEKSIKAIIEGINKKDDVATCWQVSKDDDNFYCYPLSKIEGDTLEDRQDNGIISALQSAQLQAAYNQSSKVYAIEFKISKTILEDDYSCDNMYDVASCFNMDDLDKIEILRIFELDFNQRLSIFYLKMIHDNKHFNQWELDDTTLQVLDNITEVPEVIYDLVYDYRQVDVNLI